MFKIQKVLCKTAGVSKEVYVIFEYNYGTNLKQGIHDATSDYCIAERQKGHATPSDMTLQDFVESVSDDFCKKYGFRKILVDDVAEACDGSRICLEECDFKRQLEYQKAFAHWKNAVHKTFSNLAKRIEAAQKKSPAVAGWSFFQLTKLMLVWAEEFADKYGDANPYNHYEQGFVSDKLAAMMQAEKMQLPKYKYM